MVQNYRLDKIGLVNREKNFHLNLMEKNILAMREIHLHLL